MPHWPVTRCPSCGAVAEASQAPFVLESTGGPVLHQAWSCAAGCRWHTYVLSPSARRGCQSHREGRRTLG